MQEDLAIKVLHGVIDERQSAHLGDRHLLQIILVANEVLDEMKRKKKKCLVLKVDYWIVSVYGENNEIL